MDSKKDWKMQIKYYDKKTPGTDPINILQRIFYAILFFQAFWLATDIFQPIRMLKIA